MAAESQPNRFQQIADAWERMRAEVKSDLRRELFDLTPQTFREGDCFTHSDRVLLKSLRISPR